jgi:type VI secretion system protein ImpC
MRLLLIGDFSGRGTAEARPVAARRERSVQRVDLDTLERVLARMAPQLALAAGAGEATVLRFSSLDDFHPDRLFERVAIFEPLRTLRARLLDPLTFDAATAELRAHLTTGDRKSEAPSAAAAADAETESVTLQRLLGDRSAAQAAATPSPASPIDALIRRLVAPHIASSNMPHLTSYLAAIDEVLGRLMRELLHALAFRELEVAWRGAQWLVSRLELNEQLQLHLLDVTRDDLLSDLVAGQRDPADSDLARALREAGTGERGYWTLLAALFGVGPSAGDFNLLAALGGVAAEVGAPVIVAAAPALFGCESAADLPDPRRWQPLAADLAREWAGLRHSAVAPSIGLVAPRILLRLPYGKTTDALERFAFEEQPSTPEHETLLWGPASLAVALLLGQAFADGGWAQVASPGQDIEDLPAYSFRGDGETQLQPCAEVWIGERAGQALLEQGLMPLLSDRQAPRARLMRLQSLADAPQPLAGRWLNP